MECKGKTDRTGLYIMVIIILLNSCDSNERICKIEKKLNEPKATQQQQPEATKP